MRRRLQASVLKTSYSGMYIQKKRSPNSMTAFRRLLCSLLTCSLACALACREFHGCMGGEGAYWNYLDLLYLVLSLCEICRVIISYEDVYLQLCWFFFSLNGCKYKEVWRLLEYCFKNMFLCKTEPVLCDPGQVGTTSANFSSYSVIGENNMVPNSQDS